MVDGQFFPEVWLIFLSAICDVINWFSLFFLVHLYIIGEDLTKVSIKNRSLDVIVPIQNNRHYAHLYYTMEESIY